MCSNSCGKLREDGKCVLFTGMEILNACDNEGNCTHVDYQNECPVFHLDPNKYVQNSPEAARLFEW